MNALRFDREVEDKLLVDRGAGEVGGVDRLGAAIGLDARTEIVGALDAEGVGIRGDMKIVAFKADGDMERPRRAPGRIGQVAAAEDVRPSDDASTSLARAQLEGRHDLAGHQLVRKVRRGARTLNRNAA